MNFKPTVVLSTGLLLALLSAMPAKVLAFKNKQHAKASELAQAKAAAEAPDIAKFGSNIVIWSYGLVFNGWAVGKPAESLAHVGNQTRDMSTVKNNGGPYGLLIERLNEAYRKQKYALEFPGQEGAYVLMGAAIHLIEDQASPPHAANVRHSSGDKFEGSLLTYLIDPAKADFSDALGRGLGVGDMYFQSLFTTQAKVPDLKSPQLNRYWLFSTELGRTVRYRGEYAPSSSSDPTEDGIDPQAMGDYGGPGLTDIFNHSEMGGLDGLYRVQGTQATDFAYNFMLEISKSLPAIASKLKISGAGGAPVVINRDAGNQISFRVVENRTQSVKVDLVVDGNKHIITEGGSLTINFLHRGDVFENSPTSVAGNVAWDKKDVILFHTDSINMSLLPFEADVQLTWKGLVAGGEPLTEGNHVLCVIVKDGDNKISPVNPDTCVTFRVDRTPPELRATSGEGLLGDSVVTSDNNISIYAVDKPDGTASGLKSIAVYQAVNGQFAFWFWSDRASFSARFPGHAWYFVNACDNAGNCTPMRFGVFDEDEDVPEPPSNPSDPKIPGEKSPGPKTPPLPKPPAGPRRPPEKPRQYPRPTPLTPCVVNGVAKCLPKPPAPPPPGAPVRCRWYDPICYLEMIRNSPHDPNLMYGPEGSVTPGQLMTYTIEFENEGTGEALGVYIEDVLGPALDDATLTIRDMQTVDFESGTQVPANFPWTYDAQTRTFTLFAGDAASRHGGRFVLEMRLKADSPPGTVIRNQAVVYFPNALEATPTNTIVSAVPLPTQLASVGASSETYLSIARLESRLSAGAVPVSGQPVSFSLLSDTFTALTDMTGNASGSVLLTTGAGHYDLAMRYGGDNFYYSPSAATADFQILKRGSILQPLSASVRVGETGQVSLTLTDDRGLPMERQAEAPRTVYLETLDESGAAIPLASSLLMGTSVSFSFPVPKPIRLSWILRARFDGDLYYAATSSTGTLTLIDTVAPTVSIQSPSGGSYSETQSIPVAFVASDDADPAPSVYGALTTEGGAVPVLSGESISVSSLAAGTWRLIVIGTDWAGNTFEAQGGDFQIEATPLDVIPPSLDLTPPQGSTIATMMPTIVAQYDDSDSGIDPTSGRFTLDDVDVTTLAIVSPSSAAFTPGEALAQGTHTVTAQIADFAGNISSAAATFFIDSIPPVTTLLINELSSGATSLVILSTDTVGFSAIDAGAGTLETRYALDGSTISGVFISPFTLSPGGHSLSFQSQDLAGNLEAAQMVSIIVTSPPSDTTPPIVRLDFPGSGTLGVEQALGGEVNVRGGASDASALTWTLEAAAGVSAESGFSAIASGEGNLSGLIAVWDTASRSGAQTLRLRATDAFGNEASTTAAIFVGSPVFVFAVGRKDSHVIVNKIQNPTGIAIRSDGLIWVASSIKDELVLLTSSGGVVAVIEEGIRDLKSPQGLAVDANDNLYVADKGNNRVVKLSPDGTQVLIQIAKLDKHGRPASGSGLGELHKPQDVAVDGNGDIYVADSGNSRIQVFGPSGTFLRQFGSEVLLSTSEVRGIALTAEGVWVSDNEQERVFLFSRAGALIKSIGDADSVVGEISRMCGLASDRLGALYVVEPNRDRTQKFDPQGKGLLSFGSKTGLSLADKQAKRYLTQPIDAAVAPDGSIWITDTGRDRIVRYALPASGYGTAAYAAGGGNVSSSVEPARRVVDHKDGAKVERDDGAGVHVPKGALDSDLEITVDKGDENQDKEQKTAKRRELKITAVSEEVQYGPEGTIFNTPVTLTLPYDAASIAAQSLNEDDLKVYYWNPTLQDWEAMPSVVDKQSKTVNAQTSHFSAYQVGALGGIGVAALDDFGLRDGYVFPNPTRNGSAVTFRMQPGSADSIEVRVYDLSGRIVHSSSDFRFRGALDDGNGKGAQNTYDHVWDVSGIGSAVYRYVMTAKKAGQPDIRKTGKIGIVK